MIPERLLRRRPLSLEDIQGFNGDNLGGQLDRQEPSISPQRRLASPLPESAPQAEVAPDALPRDFTPRPSYPTGAPPTMIQRNNKGRPVDIIGGDDPIEAKQELIRAQEGYKAPRSTKDQLLSLLTGGIPGAIDYATNQNTRNRWAVGEDVQKEEGQIARDLSIEGKRATIDAARMRPVYQQAVLDQRGEAQDEREINNALSQYNKLDYYDPADPIYASLREYFKSRGLNPPKKVRGSNVLAEWVNGRLVLTDKTTGESRAATESGKVVSDVARTPNAAGLTPNQQAGIDTRVSEGKLNRAASLERTKLLVQAIAARQDKQIASEVAKLGDPLEMYGAATDLRDEAEEKAAQAASETDYALKQQLLKESADLKEAAVKIQQEARKASSARGQTPARVDTRSGTITKAQQDKWLADHPGKTIQDMKALYPNATMLGIAGATVR